MTPRYSAGLPRAGCLICFDRWFSTMMDITGGALRTREADGAIKAEFMALAQMWGWFERK